jgi:hypothetical protein
VVKEEEHMNGSKRGTLTDSRFANGKKKKRPMEAFSRRRGLQVVGLVAVAITLAVAAPARAEPGTQTFGPPYASSSTAMLCSLYEGGLLPAAARVQCLPQASADPATGALRVADSVVTTNPALVSQSPYAQSDAWIEAVHVLDQATPVLHYTVSLSLDPAQANAYAPEDVPCSPKAIPCATARAGAGVAIEVSHSNCGPPKCSSWGRRSSSRRGRASPSRSSLGSGWALPLSTRAAAFL